MFDYLVVGAGFAGSVMAERLAAGLGRKVLVVHTGPVDELFDNRLGKLPYRSLEFKHQTL